MQRGYFTKTLVSKESPLPHLQMQVKTLPGKAEAIYQKHSETI